MYTPWTDEEIAGLNRALKQIFGDRMRLKVIRQPSDDACTLGELLIDGEHVCYTLEDVIRERAGVPVEQWKVLGQTAIPAGVYAVGIDYSPHFGRDMPHVLEVPGFEGVRIHPGNTASDTEGCLLVGEAQGADSVRQSVAAFGPLFDRIKAEIDQGNLVTIEYVNP
jgi:hypothetical protein